MSRSDLHPDITANYDAAHRGWRIWVPLHYVEDRLHQHGHRLTRDPVPSAGEMARVGVQMGQNVALVLAAPGPLQRDARERVKRNRYRRFCHA